MRKYKFVWKPLSVVLFLGKDVLRLQNRSVFSKLLFQFNFEPSIPELKLLFPELKFRFWN